MSKHHRNLYISEVMKKKPTKTKFRVNLKTREEKTLFELVCFSSIMSLIVMKVGFTGL